MPIVFSDRISVEGERKKGKNPTKKEMKRMQMAKVDRLHSENGRAGWLAAGLAAIEREMTIDRSEDRGIEDGWMDWQKEGGSEKP